MKLTSKAGNVSLRDYSAASIAYMLTARNRGYILKIYNNTLHAVLYTQYPAGDTIIYYIIDYVASHAPQPPGLLTSDSEEPSPGNPLVDSEVSWCTVHVLVYKDRAGTQARWLL